MTDQDNQHDPGGRWAARARAAAKQTPAPVVRPVAAPPPAASTGTTKRRLFSRAEPKGPVGTTGRVNPLLPPTDPSSAANLDVDEAGEGSEGGLDAIGFTHVSGPSDPPVAPAPLNPALPVPTVWPTSRGVPGPHAIEVQLVGLHGGAGTRTLAGLLGPQAADCGVGFDKLITTDVPVLFVTRTHAHGLDLALRIGQQYAARSLDPLMVLGLVVVYDAPQLSKGLARTLRSVQRTLPNCWTVPWDEDRRHDPAPPPTATRGPLARDARRILRKAAALRESRIAASAPSSQPEHR